jgi:hypothetical protein
LEEYFTDVVAERLANTMENYSGKFYFWTDIRTGVEQGESVSDLDVIWNNAMTYTWMRIMKPTLSMLKFRLPYYASEQINYNYFAEDFLKAKEYGCDFIAKTADKKSIPYFDKAASFANNNTGKSEFFKAMSLVAMGKNSDACGPLQAAKKKNYPDIDKFIALYCK